MNNINIKSLQYKKILKPSILGRTASAKSIISTAYDSKINQKPKININSLIKIDNKKQNKEIKKIHVSNTIIPGKEIISRYPQIFNNHNHKDDGSSMEQIPWIINLREYNDNKKITEKKYNHISEPSFYKDDLNFFMKKKLKKSKSTLNIENVPNFHKVSFLFRKRITDMHGTVINNGLINYQLSLRNNSMEEKNKWNGNTKIKYETIFNKNKDTFKRRINNNENLKGVSKRYLSNIEPYNDKYIEKNYCKIESLLNQKNRTQQNIWFQLGLNNY